MSLFVRHGLCRDVVVSVALLMLAGAIAVASVQPVSGSAPAGGERLVDSGWLSGRLSDPGLVVLDTRSPAAYAQGHIPGAVSLPVWETFGPDPRSDLAAPISRIQELFSAAGIDQDSQVVLYDEGDMINAARVFWILEMHGQQHVLLLDAGFQGWLAEGKPVSERPVRRDRRTFLSRIRPDRLATKFSTRLGMEADNVVIIDARSGAEYRGERSDSLRAGHIPGAMNIPFMANLRADGRGLRPFAELEQVYAPIDRDKKIITYCNKGRHSALTYFVLRQLGYDVSLYDGSWFEWGNDPQLPVELSPPAQRKTL